MQRRLLFWIVALVLIANLVILALVFLTENKNHPPPSTNAVHHNPQPQ